MSSGKTANLGLSQWSLSDMFRMEEFNTDNRLIDAAAASLDTADAEQRAALEASIVWENILSISTTAGCAQVNLDVSGIDWSKYAKVIIQWQLLHEVIAGDNLNGARAVMRVNNNSLKSDYICTGRNYSNATAVDNIFSLQSAILTSPGLFYSSFETEIPAAFGTMTAKTTNCGITCDYNPDFICGAALSSGAVMPLSSVSTLNFFAFCGFDNGAILLRNLLPGCKFLIYGVRK